MASHAGSVSIVLLAAGLLLPSTARASDIDEVPVPLAVDPRLGSAFPTFVAEAASRLQSRPCALLLHEFRDQRTGSSLGETLASTGLTAEQYVRSIRFRSGEGLSPCRPRRTFAWTSPGSRVVFVCPGPLASFRVREGTSIVVVVLHETLHSLGLGEDPPSPMEITVAVEHHCGR